MKEFEKKIINYLKGYADRPTWIIAGNVGLPTRKVLQIMKRLEGEGVVRRTPKTASNGIFWEVVQ